MKTKIHAFFLCALTALFAASASWAADVELQGDIQTGYYINMPATGTDNLTLTADHIAGGITSFKVYDDGGVGGEYSSNASGTLQVTAPAGYVFQVTGDIYTESGYDKLYVYDGASNGEVLYENSGQDQEIDFTGSRNSMTFLITSDGSVTRDGVNLTVTLVEDNTQYSITLNQSEGGTVTSDVESAIVGTEVTVNLNVDAGYSVANMIIEDAGGDAIEYIDGIAGSEITVTFVMPAKNVSITPTFATPRPVSIATVTMGSMESDVTEAILGTTVTLTAIPEEGALFRGVTVVGDDDGLAITTNVNGNTATFVMPNQPVTITPKFANPNVITFDENGCLNNGTYFHVSCDGSECTVSQGLQDNPNEGVTDFTCWYREESMSSEECIDYDEVNDVCLEWGMVGEDRPEEGVTVALAYAETIKLGSDLNLGGYNGTNCAMRDFVPIAFDGVAGVFDGQGYTVKGFCYEDLVGARSSMGFIEGVKTVSNVTFDNAHVVVKNTSGSVVGVVTDYVTWSDASFTNVHVTNSYVAGTQVGAFAGASTANSGMLSISTSSVVDTKVYGLNGTTGQDAVVSAAGGFLGYTDGSGINVYFSNDTIRATTAGATVVGDDASYTGTGESYRGGFVGYVYFAYNEWAESCSKASIDQSFVSGINVSGAGESNVGGIAGGLPDASVFNTSLENIAISGYNAGGAIGYMRDGAYGTLSASNDTLAGANTITGVSAAGGILGVGNFVAGNTQRVLLNSFEYINVSANVAGGKQVGGIAGSISNNSYVAMSATNVTMSGYIGATVDIMNGNVEIGGLFGHVEGGNSLTISGNAIESDFTFTNMGASSQGMLYMGPIFGYNSVENFTVYGNYSNGGISYTGIDAANASVGYIGGYANVTNQIGVVVGNYHYGSDAVAVGFGNMDAATWKAGGDAVTANVRNAVTGLSDNGKINLYAYEVSGGPSEASYMDIFPADLSDGTFEHVANGVASETEMKSPMFAAAMNYMQNANGGEPTWTQTEGSLPTVATPLEKPSYLLPVLAKGFDDGDNDAFASLTTDQKNEYGVRSVLMSVDVSETPALVTTMNEGLVGYTDANGHANQVLVDSLQAIMQTLEANGVAPYLQGEGPTPAIITANTIFTEPVEFIGVFLREEGQKTYEVAYQYCSGTVAIECVALDESGYTFLFMSPLVNQISNGSESYTTIIPDAMIAGGDELSWHVTFQNEAGENVGQEFAGRYFATFSDAIENAPSDAQKIVVGFYDGSVVPQMVVKNPSSTGFKIYMYGYNATGEKEAVVTEVTSDQQEVGVAYGSSFAAGNFEPQIGYELGAYSVSLTVTNPNEGRCQDITNYGSVESENHDIASWEELALSLENCTSRTWIVNGLSSEDTVGLGQIVLAKSRNTDATIWADTLAINPTYVPIPYNIVLNFNLTDNHYEIDDNSYTLLTTGYNNPENTQNLEENVAFPLFYGVDDGYNYISIAGWTLDESMANCVIGSGNCYTSNQADNDGVVFSSLTAELIAAATDADLLVSDPENPNGPQTMQLYPVWRKQRDVSVANAVEVGSCVKHGTECYEYPISFTLSQDLSLNGNPVHIQWSSGSVLVDASTGESGYGIRYYNYSDNVYPVDFAYEVTPGFKVNSVTPPMYNEETDKLEITGSDNPEISVDYTVLSYNVKFNIDAIGNDVYLGRGTVSSKVMSYRDGQYVFPPMYGRFDLDEEYGNEIYYGTFNWGVKKDDAYEGGSPDFDSKLVGLFEGNDYYVPAANEGENASVTLFANSVVEPSSGSSYTKDAEEIHVCAIDDEDFCINGSDGSEFHGSIVLSQSYDNDAEDVHWSFEHASEPVVQRAEDYEVDEDFVRHVIYIPSHDDTLTFDVSARPDPGYTMTIAPNFTYTRNFDGIPATNAGQVTWGFTAADATSGTLNVQPSAMFAMTFKVRYTQLAYNVAFTRPEAESGLFVGNKSVEGNYQMDWLESAESVTAETIHAPAVYNGEGCRIAWKVAGREVESRTNTDVVNELPFMAVVGDDEENPVVNTLELDAEHIVANECSGSYQLTLDAEGEGEVYFIQKVGAVPAEDGDPEQTVIKHIFIRAEDEAPMMLSIPKVYDKDGTEVGVKLTVVAVPADGYVLDALSYDIMFNGNSVTVLAQDSTELNIMENQDWHVKFEQYKPVYVTYDLALGEEDSSNVWIPTDASETGTLTIGEDGASAAMWTPYRTDKCFAGWKPMDVAESSERFTEVDMASHSRFSTNVLEPTPLLAVWTDYDENCAAPTSVAQIQMLTDDSETSLDAYDTLVLVQAYANREFTHRVVGASLSLANNEKGYRFEASILPGAGFILDPSDANIHGYVDESGENVALDYDAGFVVGNAAESKDYYFDQEKQKVQVDIAFSANSGNAVYGDYWVSSQLYERGDNLPVGSAFVPGSCFRGWSFENNSTSGTVYAGTVDYAFMRDYNARVAADRSVDTLYAVWTTSEECSSGWLTLSLDPTIAEYAVVSLYQDVYGTEVKSVELTGNATVSIPLGPKSFEVGSTTTYRDDAVYFTRAEVTSLPGGLLEDDYTVTYVNASDAQATQNAFPIAAGGSEVSFADDATFYVTGFTVAEYAFIYHENAGDTVPFYGENWSATTPDGGLAKQDSLNRSLFRADACLAGWSFDANASPAGEKVFKVVTPEFMNEFETRLKAGEQVTDLYAVWNSDLSSCLPALETITVSLSEETKGKATIDLVQVKDGDEVVVATVGADGVVIPTSYPRNVSVNGGTEKLGEYIYFSTLRTTPLPGYVVKDGTFPTYQVGEMDAVSTENTSEWYSTVDMVLSATLEAVGYTVAFDENAGKANVFYPDDWEESKSYSLADAEEARLFPKLYRTDKCLVGYGFSKDASRAESFDEFSQAFVAAYDSVVASGVESPVVYGVWNECTQTLYTVSLNEPVEGTLVLSQNGNTYDVPATGFEIPAAVPGLEFTVSFTVNDGYEFDDTGVFNVVDQSGAIVSALVDNALTVDADVIVDAPAAAKPYTFAFDVNVEEGVNVFYGDAWKASDNFALATEDVPFPTAVYRVGACLDGWTISKDAATAYTHYNAEFVAAVENANKAGLAVSTLYAKWGDCDPEQTVVTVSNSDAAAGTFTLSRTVSNTSVEYAVGETALEIPADEALDFTVSYAVNKGYTYNAMNGISAVDAADAPVEINDDVLNVATSLTLSASVSPDVYIFALDENAGEANVFYTGTLAERFTAKVSDDADTRALPMNLYRTDACLVGWNFSRTATTGFTEFSGDVVAAYEEAGTGTLYAVWDKGCEQVILTVTSADKGKGVLTLAQGNRSFEVDDGLLVPYIENGIAFTADFVPAAGYAYDGAKGFTAYSAQGTAIGTLENATATVTESISIAANGLAESEFAITFDVNAGDATVYYGNPAEGASPKYTYAITGQTAFPMNFYRTDACLTGWRVTADPAEGETVFTDFETFVAAVAGLANYTGTLYAVWGTCSAVNNVTVAQAAPETGTLTLVQRDANGNAVNTTEIVDAAVTLPLGNGDVEFAIEYTPNPGYSKVDGGYFYTVDANGNNLAALVNDRLVLAGNTIVKSPVTADAFTITFDVNVDATENVFYGSGWKSSGSYDMSIPEAERTFPTEIYRVGYELVGWSTSPIADDGASIVETQEGASYAGVYQKLDAVSVQALNNVMTIPATLYAVWVSDADQSVYTVTLLDNAVGTLELSQSVDKTNANFEVTSEALTVPAVAGGLEFSASAELNSGYFAQGNSLYLVDAEGVRQSALADGKLVVDGDKIIEIPVESDGVQFVFAENSNSRVFYETDWKNKGFFALNAETEFPDGILRTDGQLLGWAISRNSSKYYESYSPEFVEDLRNSRNLGLPTDTLYAVWLEYGTFDNIIVKSDNAKNGSFFVTQTVNEVETEPLEITSAGVEIPRSEVGLSFNVNFDAKPGYRVATENALNNRNSDGQVVASADNGGSITLGSESSVLQANVMANLYKLSYNVNGNGSNVFYGDNWTRQTEKSLEDASLALPNNIYRSDARLVGWSFDSSATSGEFDLSSEFVSALAENESEATLYAVWEPAEVETYKVSFANTNVGSLVLSQDVEDSTVSFAVSDTGLVVPVVENGLHFRAAYSLKAGYAGATDSLYRVDDLGELIGLLADSDLTVDDDITFAIPTTGESYKMVFNENREKEVLFRGDDWFDSRTYMMTDDSASFPLPAYLYTADACMVGWSLSKDGEEPLYTEFSSDLVEVLKSVQANDSVHTLYAVWGQGEACDDAYNRISLQSANGTVHLVEVSSADSESPVEHIFAIDNTLIFPKVMNGNMLQVHSIADSSYVLDSLVTVRLDGDERLVTFEGGTLPFNLENASLVAYFGKSNRNEIAFADTAVVLSGNAIQFKFTTSDFEVTRGVSARVLLETIDGEKVADDVVSDSIAPLYRGTWEKYPLSAGSYVLTAMLYDDKDTTEFVKEFQVVAEIAAVAAQGWQMISLGDLDRDAMEKDDAKFYWWDETNAFGDFWQYRELNENDKIDPTRGYWYSSLEGRPLVLKPDPGKNVESVVWSLDSINSGWNLVANPLGYAVDLYGDRPAENAEVTEKSNITFWHWNADIADYEEVQILKPYEAVWAQVHSSTEWVVPVRPKFINNTDTLQNSLTKRGSLSKANGLSDWTLQMTLSDNRGHRDSWNIVGVGRTPFETEEPPEGMGDHVKLAVVDGNRALAKSVRAPADEQEWTISLNASSERYGELSIKGVSDLNAYGLKVFVTVDGRTEEVNENSPVRVALKSSATSAVVRVAPSAREVAGMQINSLRALQAGMNLNVTFGVTDALAGSRTVVDVMDMEGHVISSKSLSAVGGVNQVSLDAPRSGMYVLRVRAGSQVRAGRILVR